MPPLAETVLLTLLALIAFALNSILTRMALGQGLMDAVSFATVRLATGALVLAIVVRVRLRAGASRRFWSPMGGRGWVGPLALFIYAAPFSFGYVRIGAAAGALLLFGAVQLSMIGWGIATGERPRAPTWIGLAVAAAGLAWLTLPAAGRPDPIASALMVLAGCAWSAYSLAGKSATDPLASNARSFAWAVPLALVLKIVTVSSTLITARGLSLAAASGGVTSALGYAIWFRALRGLTATRAAILQLSVPVIAALGAVALLHETLNPRLAIAGVAVLGGLGLVLSDRPRPRT
jgi:drug/metabolite transporter (DMT)-like permease